MSTVVVSTHVNAPAERVFEVYTDLEKAADRIPGIVSLEILSEGPVGKGTRWRETRIMFKKETTEEMEISDFDPPRSYAVAAASHGSRYLTTFEFKPDADGTEVIWTFDCEAETLGAKLMFPLMWMMKGTLKRCMVEDLEALRDACEAGG